MDKIQLKERVINQIDIERENILRIGREIYKNPETGYREHKTTKLLADELENLGLKVDRNIAVTGCRAYSNENKSGIKVAVMGELDSVICKDHTDCDINTGAMHACGHNMQTTVMYGVAAALVKSGVLSELDGRVDFMAVPAEEYIELDFREELKNKGELTYYSGKQELTYKGAFDDVSMCMMIHNFPIEEDGYKVAAQISGTGFVGKKIKFIGQEAHAGGTPYKGINALNMATIAINSMHVQRETFKDEDCVRVHQIMPKGGAIVNTVPADVQLETCIRAMNVPALKDANMKINRCVQGAAIAMGGHAEISDMPGYLPMNTDKIMADLFTENAKRFYQAEEILPFYKSTASFDIGDLSMFMPVLHPVSSGISGGLHSRDYKITSEEDAYITPIKIMACTLIDLLYDNAEIGERIVRDFKPVMTKEEYLDYLKESEVLTRY
ncbi:MAG: amidohydrolase [Clostridium sp.]|uniref:amidohydrolase n=1 Tax=Clostridium culturomicium TaxID=1499683 RepID=UPI00058F66A4|nr:amidohydrolase [Clostridium culturomicium]MDU4889495.1 amidohydrolase [Clostridium sp.]MDU7082861.1 amidohydrolase [Clostridium sp.]